MHAAQKPKSKLKFVTLDKESNISTLWRREEFIRICSKKDLMEKAQDIEVTIPVKKSQETRYNLDPGSFFVNRFWGRRAIEATSDGEASAKPTLQVWSAVLMSVGSAMSHCVDELAPTAACLPKQREGK